MLTLHHAPNSRSGRIVWLLEELDLPYELNAMAFHPPDRRDETVLGQARRLLGKALLPINDTLEGKDYLIGDFSAADIMLGHAVVMSGRLGLITDATPHLAAYVEKLNARPALKLALSR